MFIMIPTERYIFFFECTPPNRLQRPVTGELRMRCACGIQTSFPRKYRMRSACDNLDVTPRKAWT